MYACICSADAAHTCNRFHYVCVENVRRAIRFYSREQDEKQSVEDSDTAGLERVYAFIFYFAVLSVTARAKHAILLVFSSTVHPLPWTLPSTRHFTGFSPSGHVTVVMQPE